MPDNQWHLDKRVPIALIVTLLIQGVAIVWWGAQVSARLDYIERTAQNPERLARIEANMESMKNQLSRLERMLDRQAKFRAFDMDGAARTPSAPN